MAVERIHRKTERTPEETVRLRAIRERFQRERPTLEDLIASGECEPPIPQGAYRALRLLLSVLKEAREGLKLSLADVAERSGIDKAALSRLETGKQLNPTIDTLWRYAHAVGKRLTWLADDEASATEVSPSRAESQPTKGGTPPPPKAPPRPGTAPREKSSAKRRGKRIAD